DASGGARMTADAPITGPGLGAAPPPPTPEASRGAEDAYLREAFRHHSKTFSFAARFLPREVRLPVATLYLYCRTVDELADERAYRIGIDAALEEVGEMRRALDATLSGQAPEAGRHALLWRRLAEVHADFGLDAFPMHQLLDGAEWDLRGRQVEAPGDLLAYSDLVAGSVGAMMLPFLATSSADRAELDAPARALGVAMQLTNILRDVGEDARELNRIYLPAERLREAQISPEAIRLGASGAGLAAFGTAAPRYAALLEATMQEAEALYDRADAGIRGLRVSARWGIRTALRTYREILNEVRAADYDNLTRRAWVPKRRKVRLALVPGYARRRQRLAA
ncbi:MAG: phytoene/squalene synthase family protein, partial [Bacteroidota bacterium]